MAGGTNKKVSAASARAHTRRGKQNSSFQLLSGTLSKILVVFVVGSLAWAYQAVRPPPPNTCGSPGGPPVTAHRLKLSDGRYIAYKEHGVSKDTAKYRLIFVHAFDCCRHDAFLATGLSQDLVEGLGVYMVSFDRPGYGESDPNPNRTLKSSALDIEELADQLGLGPKFYVAGFSMGGQIIWTCLKYIPHRLAGAALLTPAINYWWPGLPANLSNECFSKKLRQDQWAFRVCHYVPWLTYWWNTQKWFPALSILSMSPAVLSRQDIELLPRNAGRKKYQAQVRQQGEFESIYRDMMIGFGKWEFEPMDIKNPFPNNEGSVHLWQGDEDMLVPVDLQRYIAQQLPWIRYHELSGAGHMFILADGMADAIMKSLLIGETSTP